jgi:hypothetical protein
MKGATRSRILGTLQTMKSMDTTISILVKAASLEAVFPPSDWETWTYGIEKTTLLKDMW